MYKRLRIVVPAVQVLALAAVCALKLAVKRGASSFDYYPLQELIWKVNYPVWQILVAAAYPVEWLSRRLRPPWEWLSAALGTALLVLLFSGVALLWYLVVAEVGMRRHGQSMLRFSGWRKELLAVAILLFLGGGALVEAYARASAFFFGEAWGVLLSLAIGRWYEMLGVLILTAWGFVLVGLAIRDLIAFPKGRGRGTTSTGSSPTSSIGEGT